MAGFLATLIVRPHILFKLEFSKSTETVLNFKCNGTELTFLKVLATTLVQSNFSQKWQKLYRWATESNT